MKKLLLILLLHSPAFAIPFGQDILGAARYPQVVSKNVKRDEGVGHFSNTFGDIGPVIKQEAAAGVPFIRLHLMWKDGHNFTRQDFATIEREATRLCPIVQQFRATKWYFSGACEHNLSRADAKALGDLVLKACPEVTYVNTPMTSAGIVGEFINEIHGKDGAVPPAGRYAFSFDGKAAEDSDVEGFKRRFPNAEYFLMWGPRYNGHWEMGSTVPRPQRTGWPDSFYIQSLQYLTTDKGPTSIPKWWIWKSHAENKGKGDPRAEKPVLITPVKTDRIVLKRDGKVIHVMPKYGPFGKDWRYYASMMGYAIGTVEIWINGKKQGTVNAGFRDGVFK